MKQVIKNYTFSTSAKAITLTDFTTVALDRLALITDTTTNKVLYNFADSTVATATVATNVITLSALQGGEANADKLRIDYDVVTGDPTYDTPQLPSGGATATLQSIGNSSAATTAGNTSNIPSKGAATTANSTPVNIASDQTVPVSSATLATATAQATANTSLSIIATDVAPLVAAAAGGYVRQDSTATIAKETGGNLATIATNTGNGATAANQTNATQQTKNTDGTNIVNVLKSDGTAAGQNSMITSSSYLSPAFSVNSVSSLGSVDAGNYRWVSVQISAQYTGTSPTITFQGSNDNSTWVSVGLTLVANGNVPTTATTGTGIFAGPLNYRYFRLNFTGAYTSGNATGVILYSASPAVMMGTQVTGTIQLASSSATGAAVPTSAVYMGIQNGGSNLTGWQSLNKVLDGDGGNGSGVVGIHYWNNSTADRARNNETVTLLASAAHTTTQTSADLLNYNGLSMLDLILDVTTPGTGSITVTINGKDPASGKYYLLLGGAAVTTTTTNRYRVGPYLAAVANSIAQDVLPRVFQVVVTANNANSMTYSVGYNLSRGV